MKKVKWPEATRKLGHLQARRKLVQALSSWKVIDARSRDGGVLAVSVSKMVTTMQRHFHQEERQTDGSRHWDSIEPVLMRAFADQGARDFDDGFWLRMIHDGGTKKLLEYCQDEDRTLCYFRAVQGHSGGIPITPVLMKYTPVPYNW